MAPGRHFSCALASDGVPWCYGDDDNGQLGDGSILPRLTPTPVAGVTDAVLIRTSSDGGDVNEGARVSCAVTRNRRALCWGSNSSRQLGDGTTQDRLAPFDVGVDDAIDVAAGAHFVCVLTGEGHVFCAGANANSELGTPAFPNRPTMAAVPGITDAIALDVGDSTGCVIREDETVACWGRNAEGQVGSGVASPAELPRQVPGLAGVKRIASGALHTCAVLGNGTGHCWGRGTSGQLGNNDTGRPMFVVGASDAHGLSGQGTGYPRTCLRVGTDDPRALTPGIVADATHAGRSTVVGGIYIGASVSGAAPGETVATGAAATLDLSVQAASWIPVETVEVIVEHSVDSAGAVQLAKTTCMGVPPLA